MIGDSITWRGTDELARLRPGWTIDGYPSRTYDDLASRLTWYNRGHREPTTVIVELGANPAHHVGKRNLAQILGTLPTTTLLVLLTPYRADPGSHGRVAPYIAAYTRWIQAIARRHPHSCLADWHSYVVRHPHVLVDGVHPTSHGEGVWATWVSREYHTCTAD